MEKQTINKKHKFKLIAINEELHRKTHIQAKKMGISAKKLIENIIQNSEELKEQ